MNVNAGHERTSKARIIHQIQLIRGITRFRYISQSSVSMIFPSPVTPTRN
ncbi:hypothetical protein [Shigella dysenteriae]|nr:hypothetical protein [Shigella dysenteriae]